MKRLLILLVLLGTGQCILQKSTISPHDVIFLLAISLANTYAWVIPGVQMKAFKRFKDKHYTSYSSYRVGLYTHKCTTYRKCLTFCLENICCRVVTYDVTTSRCELFDARENDNYLGRMSDKPGSVVHVATSPASQEERWRARCATTDWYIVQLRDSGDLDFARTWDQYVAGFQDEAGHEKWAGLEDIHRKCDRGMNCRMTVTLRYQYAPYAVDYQLTGTYKTEWNRFFILGQEKNYKLAVSDLTVSTAGNGFRDVNYVILDGHEFVTSDRDDLQCSSVFGDSGWWFGDTDCADRNVTNRVSSLNAAWKTPGESGAKWWPVTGNSSNMFWCSMKIRPNKPTGQPIVVCPNTVHS